jgi:hypothetical protein
MIKEKLISLTNRSFHAILKVLKFIRQKLMTQKSSQPHSLAEMVGGRITRGLSDALDNSPTIGALSLRKVFAAMANIGGAAWNAVSSRKAIPGAGQAFRRTALKRLFRSNKPAVYQQALEH